MAVDLPHIIFLPFLLKQNHGELRGENNFSTNHRLVLTETMVTLLCLSAEFV